MSVEEPAWPGPPAPDPATVPPRRAERPSEGERARQAASPTRVAPARGNPWGAPATPPSEDGRQARPGRVAAPDAPTGPVAAVTAVTATVGRLAAAVPANAQAAKVRVVERFTHQRVRHRTGPLRRLRAALGLLVTALVIGVIIASILSAAVWGVSVVIHHAANA